MRCIELRERRGGQCRRDQNQTENQCQLPKHAASFISTPDSRIWDLSPMRLGAAKTAMEIGEIAGIDAVKRVSQRTP